MKKILFSCFLVVAMLANTFSALAGERAKVYSILSQADIDDNIVSHEVIVMEDGSYFDSILTLVGESVEESDNPRLRDPGGSGAATKTYTHSITGYYPNSTSTGVNTFNVEIRYNYNSAYPGYSANAVTYIYCSRASGQGITYNAGRSENTAWVRYSDQADVVKPEYKYTVSYGNLNISIS
ncbi:MAG: hypothetical protein LBU32_19655 [Clostridiales bacterium]|jgi:hypothetical protein|nr:hypothetical protein [Clostridiales bacterium]